MARAMELVAMRLTRRLSKGMLAIQARSRRTCHSKEIISRSEASLYCRYGRFILAAQRSRSEAGRDIRRATKLRTRLLHLDVGMQASKSWSITHDFRDPSFDELFS